MLKSPHIARLLKLAGPMILSTSTITIMQIIDAAVLARHSSASVAAIGPSGMAVIMFQGLLFGTAGYCGTFVAHNYGRGDARGIRKSAWLGIYTALVSGIVALAAAWPLSKLFLLTGHENQIAQYERAYFMICMAGAFFPVFGSAMAGWLSGIGRPVIVTGVTFLSLAVNGALAWGLVLGKWGFPEMGISGAALATVAAQMTGALLYAAIFAKAGGFKDRIARKPEWQELRRFLSLALPMGLRISGELVAWTLFLVFIGRLGKVELAASSIAFRINGCAFFPALGLGQAAGVLVGHARGAGKDSDIPAIAWQSLLVCEIWMLVMALLFATMSDPLIRPFAGSGAEAEHIITAGRTIMKFVAIYCIFDAANVMIGCVLAAAGDTRWIARAFVVCSSLFLVILWWIDQTVPGLAAEWTLATLFVFVTALIWSLRFYCGGWKKGRVLQEK